eukprot:UN32139
MLTETTTTEPGSDKDHNDVETIIIIIAVLIPLLLLSILIYLLWEHFIKKRVYPPSETDLVEDFRMLNIHQQSVLVNPALQKRQSSKRRRTSRGCKLDVLKLGEKRRSEDPDGDKIYSQNYNNRL